MPEMPDQTNVQPDVVPELVLPPDGTMVRATTLPSIEYDRWAEEVEGLLYTVPSPFGAPPNCYVGGLGVESESVRAIPDAGAADGAAGGA